MSVIKTGVTLVATNETALALTEEQQLQTILDQEVNDIMTSGSIDFKPGKIGIMHRECLFVTTDKQTAKTITGTVVYFQKTRGFWDKEGQKIPRCSSMDGKTGQWKTGELEDSDTITKTCGFAGQPGCCQYNEFGSDPKEKSKGKACKEMRRLFLVESDAILPAIFNIPPTSLKAFDELVSALLSKKKSPLAYEFTFRLSAANAGGFDYSKVTVDLGPQLPAAKVLEFFKMREQVVTAAKKIGIESDDFMGSEDGAPAGAGGQTLRDDKEIY
jgi:hypothetical protein